MPERNNDLGKVRLNESAITIKVDWDANPVTINKLELDSELQQRMKDSLDGKTANMYLDVAGGYIRQRFECGPVSGLPVSYLSRSNTFSDSPARGCMMPVSTRPSWAK